MTDETKETAPAAGTEKETPAFTPEQIQNILKENEAIKRNHDSILSEKKRMQAEIAAREAEREQKTQAKLQEDGKWEQLHKSAMEKNQQLESQLRKIAEERDNTLIKNEAAKIANQLAEGYNAEILTDFLSRRIKNTDEGLRVLTAGGAETISTLDDLKKEFETDERYKSLRKGSKASGGGAAGSGAGGSGAKQVIDRATFDTFDDAQVDSFLKNGGRIKD